MNLKFSLQTVFWTISLLIFLTGCVPKSIEIISQTKITSPKVIAITGKKGRWVYQLERRLRANGFEIKAMASQNTAVEKTSDTKTEVYNEASVRYILHIPSVKGETSGDCTLFEFIDFELIDVVKNEVILRYSNSGYSDNCPPFSGSIFSDIANLTKSAWN